LINAADGPFVWAILAVVKEGEGASGLL